MILKIKIRPRKIESHYKYDILPKAGLMICYSSFGWHYQKIIDDDNIYAINYEKFRQKTEQKKVMKAGKRVTKSKVIRNAHWIGYIYCIPKFWLKQEGKIVKQIKRNFVIVDKK